MKPLLAILTALAAVLFAGCSEQTKDSIADVIIVSQDKIAFDENGGTATVSVACPSEWTADCSADWIELVPEENAKLCGVVESVIFKGVHYEMLVDCDGLKWTVQSTDAAEVGSRVGLRFDPFDIHIMKKMFPYAENHVAGVVTEENIIEFLGIRFERENLGLAVDTKVELVISPKDIEVVSEDHSDMLVFLESMIYKGAYNEFIVYAQGEQLLFHSQNDEQVATDIGISFNFDNFTIIPIESPLEKEEEKQA